MMKADSVDYRARPFLMVGPCSAESEEQILRVAEGLAAAGFDAQATFSDNRSI